MVSYHGAQCYGRADVRVPPKYSERKRWRTCVGHTILFLDVYNVEWKQQVQIMVVLEYSNQTKDEGVIDRVQHADLLLSQHTLDLVGVEESCRLLIVFKA